jgi:hypothetical protein
VEAGTGSSANLVDLPVVAKEKVTIICSLLENVDKGNFGRRRHLEVRMETIGAKVKN